MGSLSPIHWLLVIGVAVILFGGRGKISGIMGDFAKGIKAFKAGMKEPEEETAAPVAQVTPPGASTAGATSSSATMGAAAERPRDHA
ncbi:MAG TPA: twin-arginine translocase TatA/TatE family subunit [Stellaceae bacterium]|nr:twin-arginine translocase TatA/TatE family subunit [Stellaceae bacterium]